MVGELGVAVGVSKVLVVSAGILGDEAELGVEEDDNMLFIHEIT